MYEEQSGDRKSSLGFMSQGINTVIGVNLSTS